MNGALIGLGGAIVVAGAFWMYSVYTRRLGGVALRDLKLLRDLPATTIASAAVGPAKIVGRLGSDTPAVSQRNRVKVALMRHLFFEWRGFGRNRRKVLVKKDEHMAPFFIEDASGRIAFNPAEVRIDFEADDLDSEDLFQEQALRVGDTVAVVGEVLQSAPKEGGYRDAANATPQNSPQFKPRPLVTWRTEPETLPSATPPIAGIVAVLAGLACAVLGLFSQG